jgi:hypothetical protein
MMGTFLAKNRLICGQRCHDGGARGGGLGWMNRLHLMDGGNGGGKQEQVNQAL